MNMKNGKQYRLSLWDRLKIDIYARYWILRHYHLRNMVKWFRDLGDEGE